MNQRETPRTGRQSSAGLEQTTPGQESQNSLDLHVFAKWKKICTNTGNTIKSGHKYTSLVKKCSWECTCIARDSWPRYRCTAMCPPRNKPRQLVEVHRVTTPLCKMCRECFDWQLCYLGLTVPSNKWLWQLLLRRFPLPKTRTLLLSKPGQTTLHTEPGESLCWGWTELYVCACVRGGGVDCRHSPQGSLILHSGFRLEIQHCLVRGPAIKPLKDLWEQSIKVFARQSKKLSDKVCVCPSCARLIDEPRCMCCQRTYLDLKMTKWQARRP